MILILISCLVMFDRRQGCVSLPTPARFDIAIPLNMPNCPAPVPERGSSRTGLCRNLLYISTGKAIWPSG